MPNRKSYHHHDLRRALVEAVLDALDSDEADAMSMRELSARVGVSHTAAYAHFADKRALFTEAAARGFERLRDATLRAGAREKSPRARLISLGLAYIAFARRHPALYRLMFGDAREVDAKRARLEYSHESSAYGVLHDAVAALPIAGESRDPARVVTDTATAWALVHGIAAVEASAAFTGVFANASDVRRFERSALEALVRGLSVADSQ